MREAHFRSPGANWHPRRSFPQQLCCASMEPRRGGRRQSFRPRVQSVPSPAKGTAGVKKSVKSRVNDLVPRRSSFKMNWCKRPSLYHRYGRSPWETKDCFKQLGGDQESRFQTPMNVLHDPILSRSLRVVDTRVLPEKGQPGLILTLILRPNWTEALRNLKWQTSGFSLRAPPF